MARSGGIVLRWSIWHRRLIPETRVRSPVATHLLTSLNLPVSSDLWPLTPPRILLQLVRTDSILSTGKELNVGQLCFSTRSSVSSACRQSVEAWLVDRNSWERFDVSIGFASGGVTKVVRWPIFIRVPDTAGLRAGRLQGVLDADTGVLPTLLSCSNDGSHRFARKISMQAGRP